MGFDRGRRGQRGGRDKRDGFGDEGFDSYGGGDRGGFGGGYGGGGGGFGAPAQRDPAEVARDVTDGLVSVERARQVYGVALTETARSGEYAVDAEETARLRAEKEPPTGGGP